MQNLKVDIIYYQTPSDFEMEFDLGSSCPMRTLNDRVTDKKAFIKALVRDVARSRVIICCGPLFGNDGLVSIVARAIGSGTTVCDNKTYGINSDEQINIIKDSIPLVTPDGYFGGCIIESGPQTIILLTENKTFRKAIMKNLIHPYLVEISYIVPNAAADLTSDSKLETEYDSALSEDETYLVDKDDEYDADDVQSQETQTNDNDDRDEIKFVMDNEEDAQDDTDDEQETVENDTYIGLYTDIDIDNETEDVYTPAEEDQMFIGAVEHDETEKRQIKKNNQRTINVIIVAMVLMLILAVLALAYLMIIRPISMGVEVSAYLKEIFGLVSENTLV